MNAAWSMLSTFIFILLAFSVEYLCEDEFIRGPHLKIGNVSANVFNSSPVPISNDLQQPASGDTRYVGRLSSGPNQSGAHLTIRTTYPSNLQLNNHQAWPALGERNHIINRNSNTNSNTHRSDSFVQGEIKRWNSYLNTANSTSNNQMQRGHIDLKTTSHPFTGLQFQDQNGNGRNPIDVKKVMNQISDDELREFSETLLLEDENNAAKYVSVNFQGRTTSRSRNDEAPLPLLSINKDAYKIDTISKLLPLYDNYVVESDVNEDYTNQEKQEENTLLKAILNTKVMKATKNFLAEKGVISGNEKEFETLLHDMWFDIYSRGKRRMGSSGFEHVFLGEIKRNDVSGLHNWLYFEKEEKANRANYLGYLKKIDLSDKGAILKFNFDFHGINKPVGSMFIGTSPEFEMALYSTCFILRADRICTLKLNNHRFIIRTYTFKYNGKNLIGSAFPEI